MAADPPLLQSRLVGLVGTTGAARMIPATTMGGDFYDCFELPDGQVGRVIADVSGPGVPAAFVMAVARTNLRELAVRHAGRIIAVHADRARALARARQGPP